MDEHSSSKNVTRLLREVRGGDDTAKETLFEHLYTDLRRRARQQRRRWKGEPSLQTTALAHEAYLKLIGPVDRNWENRSHFFAVSARAMRHILIDRVRRNRAQKRGGCTPTLSLEELKERLGREVAMTEEDAEAFVVLDEALGQLGKEHPRAARGVECRFFGGMTIEETAEALGVSPATVSRDWKLAKAWPYRAMKRIRSGEAAGSDEGS